MESCEKLGFVKLDANLSIDQFKKIINLRIKREKNLRIKREKKLKFVQASGHM